MQLFGLAFALAFLAVARAAMAAHSSSGAAAAIAKALLLAQVGQIPLMLQPVAATAAPWTVGATTTASRTLTSSDQMNIVPVNCTLDGCTITAPGSPTYVAGTQLVLANISNSTAAPISLVGSAGLGNNCASGCTTAALAYSVANLHDGIIIAANFCGNSGGCTATPPTVSSITDTSGNVANCALVIGQTSADGFLRDEQWVCPNTAVTGADTWTVHLSGTGFYLQLVISEWSGMKLSSPAEVANGGAAAASSVTVTTNGNPVQRNDLIYCSIIPGQSHFATGQNVVNAGYGTGDGYWLSSSGSGQSQTCSWTQPGTSASAETIGAYKAATPLSLVSVAPGSGVTLYGAPVDGSGNLPLMPGAEVLLTVDGSGNYEAQYLTPPQGVGMVDEITASAFTPSKPADCYKTDEYTAWTSAQTVTIPVMVPGCVLNMIQGGSQAPKIQAGTGVQLSAFPAGDAHLAGQNAAGFVQVGGGGNIDVMGGQLAP